MGFKATIELGDVYRVGERSDVPEYGDIHVVVCMDINESILKTGKIFIAPIFKGRPKLSSHADHKNGYYINCDAAYPLDEDQLKQMASYVETLNEDQIDEMLDAMHYAEKHRGAKF